MKKHKNETRKLHDMKNDRFMIHFVKDEYMCQEFQMNFKNNVTVLQDHINLYEFNYNMSPKIIFFIINFQYV